MIAEAIGRVVQIQADLAAARALLREAGRGGAPICIPAGDERCCRLFQGKGVRDRLGQGRSKLRNYIELDRVLRKIARPAPAAPNAV